ncbi:G5 domain-containing protein [Nocardioides sp. CN2-186]|uniref:G5 domain-containing protein n=1 Tax=Nocardioides tweenelious TaxID=3156607 RepID=UPI0032B3354B
MRDPHPRALLLVVVVALVSLTFAGCTDALDPVAHHSKASSRASAKTKGAKYTQGGTGKAVTTHRTVHKRQRIPFGHQSRRSSRLEIGVRKVVRPGHPGVRVRVIRVTTKNGRSTRHVVRTVLVRRPAPRITLVGTRVSAPGTAKVCDSNYAGRCVPFASDVDCAGGSGDGPAYVSGPVRVVGIDVYDLDADGDGVGCD